MSWRRLDPLSGEPGHDRSCLFSRAAGAIVAAAQRREAVAPQRTPQQ